MEISFLVRGLLIGLSIAAQVGPMCILCIRRTVSMGQRAGFVSGLGVASADALYALVGGLGLTFVSTFLLEQQFWLRLLGGLFLVYLGISTFLAKPAEQSASTQLATNQGFIKLYGSTFLLTLTNPLTILSFAAILAGLGLGSTGDGSNYFAASMLVLGVFLGSALWWLILTSLVGAFRTRLTPNVLVWVNRISGIVIVVFGVAAIGSLF